MNENFIADTSLRERQGIADSVALPVMTVIEERLDVSKRLVESGGAVRLRKIVHEEIVTVDQPLTTEVVEVERIAMDRPVDEVVAVRYEGDVMIVPVVEERLVTRKQLVLVAELRVTRRLRPQQASQEVTVRREEVIAERLDPISGEWRPIETSAQAPSRRSHDPDSV
jgi:uncharacterized protein (TIGR02271 family)